MKRLILSALCAVPAFCMGQTLLFNDGATVKVQAGATLYVEGGIHNTATGTIDNDGTIELKGNFTNLGTWDPNQPNTLIFSGNADSDVTSGTAIFQTVLVEKDNSFHVNLLDHMTVDDNLDFNAAGTSKIYTGNNRLKIGPSGTATGYDVNEYVVTDGTGEMEKKMTADGNFFFPIGDDTDYTPIEGTWSGTAYTNAKIRTRVNDVVHPDNPADATEYINRWWNVDAIGITDYDADYTGTYVPGDVVTGPGDADDIKGAFFDGADWAYAGADAGTNTIDGSTDVATAEFTGHNFFGHVDLKAILQGPYNLSTNLMTTTLNTNGLIPLNSPYPDAPATVGAIPANVTDWVKLELRDPALPAVAVGKAAAFIMNDGSIVGLDGVSLPRIKNGFPVSVVALYHRNHLPIRTPNAGLDVVNPSLHDFSADLANAFDSPGISNDAMISLDDPAIWALYNANANGDNNINVIDLIQVKQNSNPSQFNVYSNFDVNLDRNVNVIDLIQTKQQSNPSKSASIGN